MFLLYYSQDPLLHCSQFWIPFHRLCNLVNTVMSKILHTMDCFVQSGNIWTRSHEPNMFSGKRHTTTSNRLEERCMSHSMYLRWFCNRNVIFYIWCQPFAISVNLLMLVGNFESPYWSFCACMTLNRVIITVYTVQMSLLHNVMCIQVQLLNKKY